MRFTLLLLTVLLARFGAAQNISFGPLDVLFNVPGNTASGTANGFVYGDINEDGIDDLVGRSERATLLAFGLPDGSYRVEEVDLTTNRTIMGLADFNQDGHLDIIQTTAIHFGDGTGQFPEVLLVNSGDHVGIADYDGDGDPDLLSVDRFPDDVLLLLRNNGDNTFTIDTLLSGIEIDDIEIDDIDGDGDLDYFAIQTFNDDLQAIIGTSIGRQDYAFRLINDPGLQDIGRDVVLGDMDGDGDLDAVATGLSDDLLLIENVDTFANLSVRVIALESPSLAKLADIDNDGDNDLFAIHQDADRNRLLSVYRNESGNFSRATSLLVQPTIFGSTPAGSFRSLSNNLLIRDVNNDGRRDITLTSNYSTPNFVRIALNNSDIDPVGVSTLPDAPFRLAPVPVATTLRLVNLPPTVTLAEVVVTDFLGREVLRVTDPGHSLSVAHLRAGIYHLLSRDRQGATYRAITFTKQ